MYDFKDFDLGMMVRCGAALRRMSAGAHSMEEVAERIVRHLHEGIVHGDTVRACALVRFYKTAAYGDLPPDLQQFAAGVLGADAEAAVKPELKCLTLLASAGDEAAWTSRAGSRGHKALPLPTEDFVARIPMIARLVTQFGLELRTVVEPDAAFLLDVEQRTFNVFHVADAKDSPFIPAQDFVAAHGIRSVLGFGGVLASGELFALILFSKVPIPRETADLFKTLALGVKVAMNPFLHGPVFTPASGELAA